MKTWNENLQKKFMPSNFGKQPSEMSYMKRFKLRNLDSNILNEQFPFYHFKETILSAIINAGGNFAVCYRFIN